MEINTNIITDSNNQTFSKKFENLNVSENPLPQGDGSIRISPFDDYFLFTLYDEKNGQNVPIDLSNVGTLYISFIGTNDEVKIPNYTNVTDIDMANGQVLFRISGADGKRILGLNTSNFYISSKMKGESGTTSDESVLYTGTFSSVTSAARESLTSQLTKSTAELNTQITSLSAENSILTANNITLNKKIEELNTVVNALTSSNQELSNELAELTKELASSKQTELQQKAADVQALSDAVKSSVSQVTAIQGTNETVNPKEKIATIRTLAKSNQRYMLTGNPTFANLIKRIKQNK
jgi:hypothetical protein